MRKKLLSKAIYGFSFLMLLIFGWSCSDTPTDNYLDEYKIRQMIMEEIQKNNENLEFTQWEIVNITVNKADWKWNDAAAQYEAVFDLPELTEFIYEKGAELGYVFIGTQGVDEVQKLLPYVNTYSAGNDANGNPIYFTETISCDYQLGNPSTVAFFIKSSDLYEDPEAPQTYNFRIVLIW